MLRSSSLKLAISLFSLLLIITPVFAVESTPSNLEPQKIEALEMDDALLLQSVRGDGTYPYAPVIGSGFIFGNSAQVGQCYIYVPYDSLGKWGVTQDGFLANATSSTIIGVMYDESGTVYDFNCPGFSIPRYRLRSSSSYTYTDLYLIPHANNIELATEFPTNGTFSRTYPYIIIGFLGVVVFCMMRYKR